MLALLALIAALICFVLAMFGVGDVDLIALGLALLVLALILGNPIVQRRVR
jgi:hypothetical protein